MTGAIPARLGERRQPQKRQRHGALGVHPRQFARAHDLVELIPGDLFANEQVVRFVAVERVDDVVAVTPRVRRVGIALVAGGVGVAGKVEPVTPPAFAVAGVVEQLIDQTLVGQRAAVVDKGIGHGRLGRHAEQIKIETTHQRTALGQGSRLDAPGLKLGKDECVDRVADPVGVGHLRRRHRSHRRERPALGQLRFGFLRLAKRSQKKDRGKCAESSHESVQSGRKLGSCPSECNPLFSRKVETFYQPPMRSKWRHQRNTKSHKK